MKCFILSVAVISLLVMSGCDKQRKNKDCIWTIDGKEYRTKNYTATQGKAIAILNCDDPDKRFDLTFNNIGFFPVDLLSYYPLNPNSVLDTRLYFYIDRRTYSVASDTGRIYAKEIDGKFQYILNPTPFVHDDNGVRDTIIVSAIINEPAVVNKR